jgi:hypothetical protein
MWAWQDFLIVLIVNNKLIKYEWLADSVFHNPA